MRRSGILLILVLILTLISAIPVFAQEPPDEAPPITLDTGLDNAEGKSGRILPEQETGMDQAEGASGKILPVGTVPGAP